MMHRSLWLLGVVWLVLVSACGRTPPPKVVPPQVNNIPDDGLKTATDLLRQAKDVGPLRDAMILVNDYLRRSDQKGLQRLQDQERAFLVKHFALDADDLTVVEAETFQPADAYYLEGCLLFRDTARWLEIPNLAPREQALHCFAWAMRRVLLHEQSDAYLPAAQVVRRGYGSARDRALVVIELLRQFEIESCLILGGDKETDPVLVGMLLDKNKGPDLLLLDPRLGRPVPTLDGKDIATLAEALMQPEILKAAGVVKDAPDRWLVRATCPREALAPRMQYLEKILNHSEKAVFYFKAERLVSALTQVSNATVAAWPEKSDLFHGRTLRRFLPPEEGGVDKSQRLAKYRSQLAPWPQVLVQYQNLKVFSDLPEPARLMLQNLTANLMGRYLVHPEELLVRGQLDDTLKRLYRIRSALDDLDLAQPLDDAAFQKKIAAWREQVQELYAGLTQKLENAQGKINFLWNEDQYLNNLLDPEGDAAAKHTKKMLTFLVLGATREPMGQQAALLMAQCWQEKAARAQALWDGQRAAGKETKSAGDNARNAWTNARTAWNQYVGRFALKPAGLPDRLEVVRQRLALGELGSSVALLEQLQLDVLTGIDAQHRLAEALMRLDHGAGAEKTRAALREDLALWVKEQSIRQEMGQAASLAKTQAQFSHLVQQLALLEKDWAPDGAFAAWQEIIALR